MVKEKMSDTENNLDRRVTFRIRLTDWNRLKAIAIAEGIEMPTTLARMLVLKGLKEIENQREADNG